MITDAFEHEFHLSIESKWQSIGLGALMELVQIMNKKMSVLGNTQVFSTAKDIQDVITKLKVEFANAKEDFKSRFMG